MCLMSFIMVVTDDSSMVVVVDLRFLFLFSQQRALEEFARYAAIGYKSILRSRVEEAKEAARPHD